MGFLVVPYMRNRETITVSLPGSDETHEISEGDTLNRLGNLARYNGEHRFDESPETLLREAADEIMEKIPEAADAESAADLGDQLVENPMRIDDIDGVSFYSMEVRFVEAGRDSAPDTVVFRDWKTESMFEVEGDLIAKHLGKTLYRTS